MGDIVITPASNDVNSTAGTLVIRTSDSQAMSLKTNDANRLYITPAGYFGVGTTGPNYPFDLNLGTISTNTNAFGYNVSGDATSNVGYCGYNFQLNNSTANASAYIRLARTSATAYLGLEIASQSRDGIRFLTNATSPVEVARITAAGDVGLGVTNPASKLHVSGSMLVSGSAATTITIIDDALYTNSISNNNSVMTYRVDAGNTAAASAAHIFTRFNTELVRIDAAGDLGIGISNPGSLINSNATYFRPNPSAKFLDLYSETNEADINLISNNSGDGSGVGGIYFTRARGQTDAHLQIAAIKAIQGGTNGTIAGGKLYFYTKVDGGGTPEASPQMVIGSDGNIGIGTTNPAALLDLYSSASRIRFNRGSSYNMSFGMHDATLSALSIKNSSDAATIAYFQYDGKIGIGTTNPLALLSVGNGSLSDGNVPIQISSTGPGTEKWFAANRNGGYGLLLGYYEGSSLAGSGAYVRQVTSDPMHFLVNNSTVAMSIISNGNIGMGVTTPSQKLDVNGAIIAGINNSYGAYTRTPGGVLKPWFATASANTFFYNTNVSGSIFWQNAADSATLMILTDQARLGINTNDPSGRLHVLDTVLYPPSLTWNKPAAAIIRSENGQIAFGSDDTSPYGIWQQVRTLSSTARPLLLNPLGGNIGIGIRNPSDRLHVAGSIRISGGEIIRWDGQGFIDTIGNNDLFFRPNQTFKMILTAAGRLGVGLLSPDSLIGVGGAGSTTAASGITFGADPQANLYRAAEDTIKTDGSLNVAGLIYNSNSAYYSSLSKSTNANWGQYTVVLGNASYSSQLIQVSVNGGNLVWAGTFLASCHLSYRPNETWINVKLLECATYNCSNDDVTLLALSNSSTSQYGTPSLVLKTNGAINGGYGTGYANNIVVTVNGPSPNEFVLSSSSWSQPYTYQIATSANTKQIYTNENGNVGIGTTGPVVKLEVAGALRVTGVGQIGPANGYGFALFNGGTNTFAGQLYGRANGIQFTDNIGGNTVYIASGGNVGIGLTNPSYKLEIAAGTSNAVVAKLTQGNERVRYNGFDLLGYNDGNLWMMGNNATSTILISKDWDWDSQVGIAYTPGTVGVAGGSLEIGQLTKNNASFTHGNTRFYTSGVERLRINNIGNVGIGTNNPGATLQVYGGATANNNKSLMAGDAANSLSYVPYTTAGGWNNASVLGGSALFNSLGSTWLVGTHNGPAMRIGTNNISFTNPIGGIDLYVGSGANIGISNTAPKFALHVNGDVTIPNARYLNFNPGELQGNSMTRALVVSYSDNTATTQPKQLGIILHNDSNTNDTFSPALVFGSKSNSSNYSQATAVIAGRRRSQVVDANWHGGELWFWTATSNNVAGIDVGIPTASPAMVINSTRNVGIGTSNPGDKLQVNLNSGENILANIASNGVSAANKVSFRLSELGTALGEFSTVRDGTNYQVKLQTILGQPLSLGTSGVTRMVIDAVGYVGVGITNPTARLQIVQSNAAGVAAILLSQDESTIQGPSANTQIRMGGNLVLNAANVMPIGTNGAERIRITAAGLVGIGTNTPTTLLSVGNAGSTTAASGLTFGGDASANLYRDSSASIRTDGGFLAAGRIRSLDYIQFNSNLYSNAFTNPIDINVGNVAGNAWLSAIRFNQGGYVGIGTNVPSGKLHVVSSVAGETVLRADGTNGILFSVVDDLSDSLMSVNNSAGLPVLEVFADDRIVMGQYGANDFVLANNKIGLGTNNPEYELDIVGAGTNAAVNIITRMRSTAGSNVFNTASVLAFTNTTTNSNAYSYIGGRIDLGGAGDNCQSLVFATNATNTLPTEKMRITSAGNVGIGSTDPQYKLDVYGTNQDAVRFYNNQTAFGLILGSTNNTLFTNIVWTTSNGNAQFFKNRSSTSWGGADSMNLYSSNGGFAFHANGVANRFNITTAGDVGIGASTPSQKLDVRGFVVSDVNSNSVEGGFFLGNQSHGIRRAAGTNDVRLHTNGGDVILGAAGSGSQQVTLKNGGNFGINISTPTSKLHVVETTPTGSRIQLDTASANAYMNAGRVNDFLILTAPFNAVPASNSNNNAKWGIKLNGSIDSPNTNSKTAAIYAVSEEDVAGGAGYNRKVGIALHTSAFDLEHTERVRIDNLGNVGIGITNPAYRLVVSGGDMSIASANILRFGAVSVLNTSSNANDIYANIRVIRNESTVNTDGMYVNYNSNGATAAHLRFYASGSTERMRIDASNGNVGIATTSPFEKLDVRGGILRTNTRVDNTELYPVGHYAAGETVFEIDPTWSQVELQRYFNNSNVTWEAVADAPGGYCIYINGSVDVGGPYGSGFPYIPVDTNDVFYMECWIQNVGTAQGHYMGSQDLDQNFGNLGGNPGSYGYWVMSNYNPGTSWIKVTGYIGGFSNTIGQFKAGTKYWTPLALFNYTAGTGTRACRISGWKVIKVYQPGNRFFAGTVGIGLSNSATILGVGGAGSTSAASGITFGADSAANIYRSSTSQLKTDGSFVVTNTLTVGGADLGARVLKNGSDSISSTLYLANAANSRAYNFQPNAAGTNLALWAYNSSNAWINTVNFNYDGNVGIGASPVAARLHIKGDGLNPVLRVESAMLAGAAGGTAGKTFVGWMPIQTGALSPADTVYIPLFK